MTTSRDESLAAAAAAELTSVHDRQDLSIWVVYSGTSDYPASTVARRWMIAPGVAIPTADVIVGDIEELRNRLACAGFLQHARDAGDDPVIVESWF